VHCLVNNGEMQKDRARHARHENPALPSRGRESGYDCHALLLTTSTSAEALSGTRLNPLPSPPLPCPSLAGAARLCEAEPLGGFLLRRPLTRARCGGGIALSHLRAGCSAVSAGGTAHAR
jgi:hypothetical protein